MRTLDEHGRPRPGRTWRIPLAALIAAALCAPLSGCRDQPRVVIESARDALKQKDADTFLALLTPRSADFLRQADKVGKKSARAFKVLRAGRPSPTLLPKGDLEEPAIDGQLCTVMAKKGTLRQPVIMRLIRGQWRIDLLEMSQLQV